MSSQPPPPGPGAGPSIRLNLQSNKADPSRSSTASGQGSSSSSSPPRTKKRRFEPPSLKPNTAQVHNLQVLHQKSVLSFLLHRSSNASSAATWFATGLTTLYVVDDSSDVKTAGKTDISTGKTTFDRQFALHLRGTCNVTSVEVESMCWR